MGGLGQTDTWLKYCGTAWQPAKNGENKHQFAVSGETGLLDSKTNGNTQRYWFKFLTPSDYDDFFQAVQSGNYRRW